MDARQEKNVKDNLALRDVAAAEWRRDRVGVLERVLALVLAQVGPVTLPCIDLMGRRTHDVHTAYNPATDTTTFSAQPRPEA
jgi:hypothetical protein